MNTKDILTKTLEVATSFIDSINEIPPDVAFNKSQPPNLPENAMGFQETLHTFLSYYGNGVSATSGPRYFGYVIGGSTPASIAGDWLASAYDQISPASQVTDIHEKDTVKLLLDLFNLPQDFDGSFTSGATMSNMVNLGTARQWYGLQMGVDTAKNGLFSLPSMNIFSASAHSSSYKSLSMVGIGRDSLTVIDKLPGREAMNMTQLEEKLNALNGAPSIVIASAGTVNTGDFDNFQKLKELKSKYNFWLHTDGAFGGFAACSKKYRHLLKGWEASDSITIDAHKWLNIPYDSAFQFTRHIDIQQQVFQNSNAPYVEGLGDYSFIHITPQGSRRWRSLAAWFSLLTTGKNGYQEMVDTHCGLAKYLESHIKQSPHFELLAETPINMVCFKVSDSHSLRTEVFLKRLNATKKVYLTPTVYKGEFAIRCAICNWRTTQKDMDILIGEMERISIEKNK